MELKVPLKESYMPLVAVLSRAVSNLKNFAFGSFDKSSTFIADEEKAIAVGGESVAKVFSELRNTEFDFRTARGLARAVGISEGQVTQIIQTHDNLIRMSPAPGPDLQPIYVLKSRSPEPSLRELVAEWQMVQKGHDLLEPA